MNREFDVNSTEVISDGYLHQSLIGRPYKTSDRFAPERLFAMRFVAPSPVVIAGLGLRMSNAADGSGIFVLAADRDGQPDEVLFSTEARLPHTRSAKGWTSTVITIDDPFSGLEEYFYGIERFWLGFRLSGPTRLPIRARRFSGMVSDGRVDEEHVQRGKSLAKLVRPAKNEADFGQPILFPVYLS